MNFLFLFVFGVGMGISEHLMDGIADATFENNSIVVSQDIQIHYSVADGELNLCVQVNKNFSWHPPSDGVQPFLHVGIANNPLEEFSFNTLEDSGSENLAVLLTDGEKIFLKTDLNSINQTELEEDSGTRMIQWSQNLGNCYNEDKKPLFLLWFMQSVLDMNANNISMSDPRSYPAVSGIELLSSNPIQLVENLEETFDKPSYIEFIVSMTASSEQGNMLRKVGMEKKEESLCLFSASSMFSLDANSSDSKLHVVGFEPVDVTSDVKAIRVFACESEDNSPLSSSSQLQTPHFCNSQDYRANGKCDTLIAMWVPLEGNNASVLFDNMGIPVTPASLTGFLLVADLDSSQLTISNMSGAQNGQDSLVIFEAESTPSNSSVSNLTNGAESMKSNYSSLTAIHSTNASEFNETPHDVNFATWSEIENATADYIDWFDLKGETSSWPTRRDGEVMWVTRASLKIRLTTQLRNIEFGWLSLGVVCNSTEGSSNSSSKHFKVSDMDYNGAAAGWSVVPWVSIFIMVSCFHISI